jgi:tetratricopeptide (TPR) repeat protein
MRSNRPRSVHPPRVCVDVARLVLLIASAAAAGLVQADAPSMRQRLEARVRQSPDDAVGWRLLAQVRHRDGDGGGALEAAEIAVELDPKSAAAKHDLGRYHLESGASHEASRCFRDVLRLAPESEYAVEALDALRELGDSDDEFQTTTFEIRRFDRTDLVPELAPPEERFDAPLAAPAELPRSLDFRVEAGVLFNSNVTLAPTSRELSPDGNTKSFQTFVSPELEYSLWNTETWRAGPTFQAYGNLNESHLSDMDLISFRPGLFAERLISLQRAILIPRVEYSYTHDSFGGDLFAQRHAGVVSSAVIWPSLNESNIYWVSDYTDYAFDGDDPSVTSRDGWTNTLGVSHRIMLDNPLLQSVSAGVEGQHAETTGANFRYDSIGLFVDAEMALTTNLSLIANAGWAYRNYPDAVIDPSRNENVWSLGARLQYAVTPHWSFAGVASYDRFDSRNELFNSDRLILGFTTTYRY